MQFRRSSLPEATPVNLHHLIPNVGRQMHLQATLSCILAIAMHRVSEVEMWRKVGVSGVRALHCCHLRSLTKPVSSSRWCNKQHPGTFNTRLLDPVFAARALLNQRVARGSWILVHEGLDFSTSELGPSKGCLSLSRGSMVVVAVVVAATSGVASTGSHGV